MPETPSSPREIVARFHQAMLDKSADDLADLYAADGLHEFPFLFPGFPPRLEGREAVRAGYRRSWGASPVTVKEIRKTVHETADPRVVVVEHELDGTVAPTGRPFAIGGLLVLRIENGLITHCRDYMDGIGVAHGLGRLPEVVAALSDAAT